MILEDDSMTTMFLTFGALIVTVLVHNVLGSLTAILEGTYDKEVAKKGLIKGGIVSAALVVLYFAGYMCPDITIMAYNETALTLSNAIYMITSAGFVYYAAVDVKQLAELIGVKVTETNKEVK